MKTKQYTVAFKSAGERSINDDKQKVFRLLDMCVAQNRAIDKDNQIDAICKPIKFRSN